MSLSTAIQNELSEASGGMPVARIRTMEEILSRSTAPEHFNALVLTIFGCSALLLAAIGIYGLMATRWLERAQEIGIRLALGAESSHIRNMVVFQGLRPALAGVVLWVHFGFWFDTLDRQLSVWCGGVGSPGLFFGCGNMLVRCAGRSMVAGDVRASQSRSHPRAAV